MTTEAPVDQASSGPPQKVPFSQFLRYFLSLGAFGFGGPIATVGYMQRDLVEERSWLQREDFLNGVALGQTMPGPLAAQVVMWVGYLQRGPLGALATAIPFILPSYVLVLTVAVLYVPFLREGVVVQHHWLTERQFLDAVAMGLITPGPVVITAAFIGYLVHGAVGALVATIAIFTPIYLGVAVPGRWFIRHKDHPFVK